MAQKTFINHSFTFQATQPSRNVRITAQHGLYVSDSFVFRVTVAGLPTDTILTKAYFTVKTLPTDVDGSALFQKTITTSQSDDSGQITEDGEDLTYATLHFECTTTNTGTLTANATHFFDISVISDDSSVHTIAEGVVVAGQGVTAATT